MFSTILPALLPLTATYLIIKRTLTRATVDHQYSPSKWSNRLASDGSKQFTTPDDVVWGNVKGNHVSTVGDGSAMIHTRHQTTAEYSVKHQATRSKESTLDIYYSQNSTVTKNETDGDIIVYIHGGYWQALDKKSSCWCADTMLQHGQCSAFVAVGYDLCPTVSFDTLVQQVKSSVAYVLKTFPKHRIHVVGHSAGGHLGAEILMTDWRQEYGIVNKSPVGFCLVSGVFDLRPIYRSYVNDACQMSEKEAVDFSPMLRVQSLPSSTLNTLIPAVPVLVAVGQHDSPAFKQQSQDFYNLLKQKTNAIVTYLEMPGEDHFTSIERLVEVDYVLSKAIRADVLQR